MLLLMDGLRTHEGGAHAMWGLLPGQAAMQPRLVALGPQRLDLPAGSLRGHTFHHSRTESPLAPIGRTVPQRGGAGEALYQAGGLRASYFHAWFPSSPAATASLFLPEASA